jgi:hypothetical protein
MASDAHLANHTSIAAHKALGFNDEAPTVRFRKWLPTTDGGRKAEDKEAHELTVVPLDGTFAVCRLVPDAPLPAWAAGGAFVPITCTDEELSVVCRQEAIPEGVRCERGWRCLRVAGTLDVSLVGVLASLLDPLADAGVSVFVLSTFDTDYLLVKQANFQRTVDVLLSPGQHPRGGGLPPEVHPQGRPPGRQGGPGPGQHHRSCQPPRL